MTSKHKCQRCGIEFDFEPNGETGYSREWCGAFCHGYEAGQRQGMARATEIADTEMKDYGFSREMRFGMRLVRDLIRKEIKP